MKDNIKVFFPIDEAYPLFKIGGLGDVGGSLPKALAKIGVDVRIGLPLHPEIERSQDWQKIKEYTIIYGGEDLLVIVWRGKLPNSDVLVYLFEEKKYLSEHTDAGDNHADKFAVFSLAVAKFLVENKEVFSPDIVHLHDWHTALVPMLLKHVFGGEVSIKSLISIHNLSYQGNTQTPVAVKMGIPEDACEILAFDRGDAYINILLEGLMHADLIGTVSPRYAQEILTPDYGQGINEFLEARKERLVGILNGIDLDVFDPQKDSLIFERFGVDNVVEGKRINKEKLGDELGLSTQGKILIGFVGRVDPGQKGVQLIVEALKNQLIPGDEANFVFLGAGDPALEKQLHETAKDKEKVKVFTRYDEALAAKIYAASDFVIIPSKFEPCGLVQMIAMRYGSLPVARMTGGLADTIEDGVDGFLFEKYETKALVDAIERAKIEWRNQEKWMQMVRAAMKKNFSWDQSAKQYQQVYMNLVPHS